MKTRYVPNLHETLEDRTVPTALLGSVISDVLAALGGGGCNVGGGVISNNNGTSSVLAQDARSVSKAFQTFTASYQADVAALRLTATTTTAPTSAGLTAFNASIATAINTLNTSISSDLSNLTNTGASLTSTIDGYTATLQTEVDSAGTGLASSKNASVNALYREVSGYLWTAENSTNNAILSDKGTGEITSAAINTYNKAARTAYQTFNTALLALEQTAISGKAALSLGATPTAVDTLQSNLDAAITTLGVPSTTNATVNTALAKLTTSLDGIAAPSGSNASNRLFLREVSQAVSVAETTINKAVTTAIQTFNNSLL